MDPQFMLHRLPLSEMAALARSGVVSSLELVDAHLDRIEQRNPHINAFTMVLADQARESARRADQSLKSGRLHGVPTPVNERIQVVMAAFVRRGGKAGSVAPADV